VTTLITVANYISAARTLLQDNVDAPYRYSSADIVEGLNLALMEARRLRPDLFLVNPTVPQYEATAETAQVAMDQQYRLPVLYYIVGHSQLRDEEDTQDNRAVLFTTQFAQKLLGLG
jgi:hypothetical protein